MPDIHQHGTRTGSYDNRLRVMLNSFIAFTLATLLLFFLNDLVTAIVAKTFGIKTKLFFNRVEFIGSYYRWDKLSVTAVFSSAPILFFILGLVFYYFHHKRKYFNGFLNLFFLWSFVICMILCWGNLLYSSIVYRGVAAVYAWLKISDVLKFALSILSFFVLTLIGVFLNKSFLRMTHTRKYIKRSQQSRFLFFIAFLPFLLGSLLVLGINAPFFYTTQGFLTKAILFMSLGVMIFATTFLTLNTSKRDMIQSTYGFELQKTSLPLSLFFIFFIAFSLLFMKIGVVI